MRGCNLSERNVATANIPGRKEPSRFASTMRTLAERVLGSRTREILVTLPWQVFSGYAFKRIYAASPK